MDDKKLQILNDGKMAMLAYQHMNAIISDMKAKKVAELCMNFRSGKIDQATLASGVAGFCSLEELEMEIKRRIFKGERASQELNQEQRS
jgi:hypothetical protein